MIDSVGHRSFVLLALPYNRWSKLMHMNYIPNPRSCVLFVELVSQQQTL